MTATITQVQTLLKSNLFSSLTSVVTLLGAAAVLLGPISLDHEREATAQALRSEMERDRTHLANERQILTRTNMLLYHTMLIRMLSNELRSHEREWEKATEDKEIDYLTKLIESTRQALIEARHERDLYIGQYKPPIGDGK